MVVGDSVSIDIRELLSCPVAATAPESGQAAAPRTLRGLSMLRKKGAKGARAVTRGVKPLGGRASSTLEAGSPRPAWECLLHEDRSWRAALHPPVPPETAARLPPSIALGAVSPRGA